MCRTCGKRHNSYDLDPSSSTQQDGSLDSISSVNFGLGSHSPGKFSLRGRNMKEYEEQLKHLKEENFNLKLRVYFLEEKIGQKGLNEDKDDLCRENMELKVEKEALKKELYEKQELVRQASIVLATLDNQHREKMEEVQMANLYHTEELQERITQLERIEPQIEVRVQEIIERDRIIEEKMEQLEQQNKILVEIQITLDEQQKQNAELEANLAEMKHILQEKTDQLDVSCGTVKELAEKLMVVERDNNKLRKDLNRKEKKVQDLKIELKETMEMLQKNNMESQMICQDDGVKEMAQDEHEGLWAELELRNKEVEQLRKEKEITKQEAEARMAELERRAAFAERLLMNADVKETVSNPDSIRLAGLYENPEEIKQLQNKLFKGQENVNNLDLIKEILQGFNFDKNLKREPIADSKDTPRDNQKSKTVKDDFSSEKPQGGVGFSTLENALFAHMGQKVYNTSQTFNTYVLSGSNEDENNDSDSAPQVIPCAPPELFESQSVKVPDKSSNLSQCSTVINSSLPEPGVKKLSGEMGKLKRDAKTLREDHRMISEQQMNFRNGSKQSSINKLTDSKLNRSRIPVPSKTHEERKAPSVINLESVMDDLKNELKRTKKVITLQMFDLASKKCRDSLQKYKAEICSLRKRLADSHNACDMLRTRLEELVDFLEQIVDMDKKGIINLSSWTPQRRATLNKTLSDSRALSHSLSQSLMIGMESMIGDTSTVDGPILSLVMDTIPPEFDISHLDSMVGNCTLNNTVNVFDISFDLSTADTATADIIYETIEDKLNCLVDSKSAGIEDMSDKFEQISDIFVSKEKDLWTKTNVISNLKDEVILLRDEISVKNDILSNIENETKSETIDRACSPLKCLDQTNIQKEYIKQQQLQIEQISEEKRNQHELIAEQKLMITDLRQNINFCQEKLETTLHTKEDLEKELERVSSKILRVSKENCCLLVDKTNLQSQLSSADANVNFLKKNHERSVSRISSEHDYEKLLSRYKTYQTAVVDLEKQNDKLSVENETYKQKTETLQEELKTIFGRIRTKDRCLSSAEQLANVQSSHDAIESNYSQLQSAYDKVIRDKSMLEMRLQSLEPKLLINRSRLTEVGSNEAPRHFDQFSRSPSNKENIMLKARLAQYENVAEELSSLDSVMSARSVEFLQPNQLDHYRNTSSEYVTSPNRSLNQYKDTDGQSNLSPRGRHSNMDSSIGRTSDSRMSDRHSSNVRFPETNLSGWQKAVECTHDLCTDPSHSELTMKNEQLKQYNRELEQSLRNTKSSLKDTLDSVTTAKEKQESVERAICKQLSKTHKVLRKAKGNMKRNEKQSDDD